MNSIGTVRSPSRPAALLGTVALGVRFAEHWALKITDKEKEGRENESLSDFRLHIFYQTIKELTYSFPLHQYLHQFLKKRRFLIKPDGK